MLISIIKNFNFAQFISMSIGYGGMMMLFQNWSLKGALGGGAAFGFCMSLALAIPKAFAQQGKKKIESACESINPGKEIDVSYGPKTRNLMSAGFLLGIISSSALLAFSIKEAIHNPQDYYLVGFFVAFMLFMIAGYFSVRVKGVVTDCHIKGVRKYFFSLKGYAVNLVDVKQVKVSVWGNVAIETVDGKSHVLLGVLGRNYLELGEVDDELVQNEFYRHMYRLVEEIKRRANID